DTSGTHNFSRRLCSTFSYSLFHSTQLSTNTLVRRHLLPSHNARSTRVAATAESTPPDNAQMARTDPTCLRTAATVASTKCWGVHVGLAWQIFRTKLRRMSVPRLVWWTSGWNWTANRFFCAFSIPATALGDFAMSLNS